MMAETSSPTAVHCYTNPSFCRRSEFVPDHDDDELPPPPGFQPDDLPPPPPLTVPIPIKTPSNYPSRYGHTNPVLSRVDPDAIDVDRYEKTTERNCYHDETGRNETQGRRVIYDRNTKSRYEYIDDDEPPPHPRLQRRASLTRFEMMTQRQDQNFTRQASYHGHHYRTTSNIEEMGPRVRRIRQDGSDVVRYGLVPADEANVDCDSSPLLGVGQVSPRGRYGRVPMQDEEPPLLPERNGRDRELRDNASKNNLATQRLHAMLTTPRKRSRSEERNLSPGRATPRFTPPVSANNSPAGRGVVPGSSRRGTPVGTPQRALSPNRTPLTSTPNKDSPSARRCLPLNEQQELGNYGRMRYGSRREGSGSLATSPIELSSRFGEPPPRYAFVESPESIPMVIGSPKYQVLSQTPKRGGYTSVESAFIARTAVVPPLSPQISEANTTLISGTEKEERKRAPLLLILVGILTCGLALYFSWSQGRKYYLDSAAGCGLCCTLAGACRSLRRTWTGLGLAGLSAVSCLGLLLLATKQPRPGTPLHDVTAGALCGVSLLGAGLALLALLGPRCTLSRHRRVHSWIPNFSA
ncbi:uncharacterized protein spdo [Fopius arisanus]|uniref:Uncharacterized protein spdo n=1 Tax=Fopius arisanus TaxID=64838 RepID=A0A9R1U5N5_9HYME|nr:PREDICTED: uncharacterized protein LOC105269485 [Fopius arisanus]